MSDLAAQSAARVAELVASARRRREAIAEFRVERQVARDAGKARLHDIKLARASDGAGHPESVAPAAPEKETES